MSSKPFSVFIFMVIIYLGVIILMLVVSDKCRVLTLDDVKGADAVPARTGSDLAENRLLWIRNFEVIAVSDQEDGTLVSPACLREY